MGSAYVSKVYYGQNVGKWFAEDFYPQQLDEHGSGGYSGSFAEAEGLEIRDRKVFPTFGEAKEWLLANCSKNEAIAVPVTNPNYRAPTRTESSQLKTLGQLDVQLQDLKKQLDTFETEVLKRWKSAKSQTRSCPECDSRYPVKRINWTECPVCCKSMLPTTDANRKAALALKLKTVSQKKAQLSRELTTSYPLEKQFITLWYIGCWAAE